MFGFFWLLTFDVNNNYFSSIFLVEAKHLTRITYPRGNFHSHWRMTFICVTWVSLHLKNFKLKWCDVFRTKLILEPFLMPNHRITRKLPTFRYLNYRVSHSKGWKVILLWWGHIFWFLLIFWVLRFHEIGSFMSNSSVYSGGSPGTPGWPKIFWIFFSYGNYLV